MATIETGRTFDGGLIIVIISESPGNLLARKLLIDPDVRPARLTLGFVQGTKGVVDYGERHQNRRVASRSHKVLAHQYPDKVCNTTKSIYSRSTGKINNMSWNEMRARLLQIVEITP